MRNYIYVFIDNRIDKVITEKIDEIAEECKADGVKWIWLKSARELLLVKDDLFYKYDRVIINLPANDTGVACATIVKDYLYKLSWTAHYAGNGYHDYMDLIRGEMKI